MHLIYSPLPELKRLGAYRELEEQGGACGMFLLSSPSWLSGFARTFDIAGVFDPAFAPLPPAQTDWASLACDLKMIREDLLSAIDNEEDDPRTRLISDYDLAEVRLEVVERQVEEYRRLLERRKEMLEKAERQQMINATHADKNEDEGTPHSHGEVSVAG